MIPARLRSGRLERKVLADIGGQTMLRRTHQVALRAACGPVLVLTDAEEVASEVRSFGGEVLITDPGISSGTARIASVIERLSTEVVVNLQADAPLTDPAVVVSSAAETVRSGAEVTLPVARLSEAEQVLDPSVVKVVRRPDGRALYCSRSPIPHVREAPPESWPQLATFWSHVGLYAYTHRFLSKFARLPPSSLEESERLEQLRWLEAGVHLHTFEVVEQGPSVDTAAQLELVRARFLERAEPSSAASR